jgi:hypothetical protein
MDSTYVRSLITGAGLQRVNIQSFVTAAPTNCESISLPRPGPSGAAVLSEDREPSAIPRVANGEEPPPSRFALGAGLVNPTREPTRVRFDVPLGQATGVAVAVYNVVGRRVRSLVNEGGMTAGRYDIVWDLRDASAARVGDGVYFIYMETTDGFRDTKKLTVRR